MQVARAFTAVRPARSAVVAAPQRTSVVVQAKPTKIADFKGLSDAELSSKVDELKVSLARTKWLQATQGRMLKPNEPMAQPDPERMPKGHLNKHMRLQIAQCLTLLRQRQIEQGIDRRTARRMEKRQALIQKAAVF